MFTSSTFIVSDTDVRPATTCTALVEINFIFLPIMITDYNNYYIICSGLTINSNFSYFSYSLSHLVVSHCLEFVINQSLFRDMIDACFD